MRHLIANHVIPISGRVARLSDIGHHGDKEDDESEKFFAGGSEHRYVTIATVKN